MKNSIKCQNSSRGISFILLLLFLSITIVESVASQDTNTESGETIIQNANISDQQNNAANADTQDSRQPNTVFQNLNYLIKTYFDNCTIENQSTKLIQNCSIQKKKFSQFLYGVFHKEILMGYILFKQRQNPDNEQIQDIYQKGQDIRKLAVEAYDQWISIYFSNNRIQVQEFYECIDSIQQNLLDVIQHIPKYQILTKIKKQIKNVTLSPKEHISQGEKSNQEIQMDIALLYAQNFDDQCQFPIKCAMPLNRFVYFVKQIAYYMIPIKEEWKRQNGKVLISPELDFKITQFLLNEVQKLKTILGEQVDYQQTKQYTFQIAETLFQHLIEQNQKSKNIPKSEQENQNAINLDL